MNFSLFKKNSIFSFNNITSLTRRGKTFSKSLGAYNYKRGPNKQHKNPHAISLKLMTRLKKNSNSLNDKKIRYMRLNSSQPFGKFIKRKFILNYSKIPMFDIPETSGFYLKPYLAENNKIFSHEAEDLSNKPTMKILSKIRTQMLFSKDPEVVNLGIEMFETNFGKSICKEFISNSNAGRVFDRKNPFLKHGFLSQKKAIEKVSRVKINKNDVLRSIYPTEAEVKTYSENKEDILSLIDKKVEELESDNKKLNNELNKRKKEKSLHKKIVQDKTLDDHKLKELKEQRI